MTFASLFADWGILCVFLLVGYVLRECIPLFKKIFLPASVVGGFIALIGGQQVLGWWTVPKSFASYSGALITLVMTCLVWGVSISRERVKSYGDYFCLFHGVYFMQIAVGAAVGMLLRAFWTDLPLGWGTMGVAAYLGGHGTVAAYGGVFKGLGIVENTDLGMVMATLGLLCAVTVGMVWVNIGLRKGWCQFVKPGTSASLGSEPHLLSPEQRTSIGSSRVPASGINALAFQFAMLMAVITLGTWAFKFAGRYVDFFNHIPGNFIGVIAAVVLWPLMKVVHLDQFVDRKTCSTISGFSLEILIVAAVSTMNLKLVSIFIKPILIHFAAIVTLTSVICFWYNRKISADQWFEKAVFVFGQATGTTPSGLALVRTIDPDSVACPGEAHGIASGFGIPVTFWIPALMPVLAVKMPWAEVGIGALGAAVFLVGGWPLFRKDVRKLGR